MRTDPRMLEAFDRFREQISDAYRTAQEQLKEGKYNEAHSTLAHIAQVHAKTALSLRNVLIRRGLVEDDE